MGTSDIVTSKEGKYKKLQLTSEGPRLKKFGKGNSHVKICCLSDTHELHEQLTMPKNIDILLYGGDFTNWITSNETTVNKFLEWLKGIDAKYKILVCGNHELYFSSLNKSKKDSLIEELKKGNIFYLENSFAEFKNLNLNVFGFPHILKRNIFYRANAFEISGQKMNEICNQNFDKKMDILVTHVPPYHILDKTYKKKNLGSLSLLEDLILRVKPKIHIFGHNHDIEGYQIYKYEDEEFLFINASKAFGIPFYFDYYYD